MQKPAHTISIVNVNAGGTIPDTLLQKLLSENRSAIGFVVREGNKLEVERFGTSESPLEDVEKTLAQFKDILGNTKKYSRMFCFHSFPEEFDEDEIQPFIVIRDSKNNPILVVALEGDFPGREVDGSSEMYGLMHEYVGPKIESLYKLLGNSPAKLFEACRDPLFGKDLLNTISHRGVFAFMPSEGEPFAHGQNDLGGVYDWGTASNVYGYTESVVAAATPAAAAPTAKRSKYASAEEPKVDQNGIHHIAPKVDPVVPKVEPQPTNDPIVKTADAIVDSHVEVPPKQLHGKKLKLWYRNMNSGVLPADWEKRPSITVKHKSTVKSLEDLAQTAVGAIRTNGATTVVDTTPIIPILDGKQQAAVQEFITKYLDASSNTISNPLEMQKIESKLAVFSEVCLKNDLFQIETWPTTFFFALSKSHPEAAALLMIELRREVLNRRVIAAIGDKKVVDLVGTSPTGNGTAPVASVPTTVSKVEAPAHKKSKYA